MAQQYISIRQIADNLYVHPLLQDIPFERIVNCAVDFSRMMGLPQIFEDRVARIEIHDHRGVLPCDYYNVVQVKESCSSITFVAATDSFFYSSSGCGPLTYRIQGNFIFTSIEEGTIEMAYNAIPLDKDGYPLLPDDSMYTRALELFIKKQWFTIQYDMGRISAAVMNNTQQEYYVAVQSLRSEMSTPTVDEMEGIARMWNRLLPADRMHQSGFINAAFEEHHKLD